MRCLALPVVLVGMVGVTASCTTRNTTATTEVSTPTEVTTTSSLPAATTTTTTLAPASTPAPTAATTIPPTAPPPTTPPPTEPATTTTVPVGRPLVLSEHGIGSADFGADPDAVVDYVSFVLGASTTDSGWVDAGALSCPGTSVRLVSWRDLTVFLGDESDGPGGRRHFFGYTYGPAFGQSIDPLGPATDGGITVGSTVERLLTVFPAAGVNPADDATAANFTIIEGLSGYLTGDGPDDTITEFVGGLVCAE